MSQFLRREETGVPSKSGWDQRKLSPHTTFVVEVEGVIDVLLTIIYVYIGETALKLNGLWFTEEQTWTPYKWKLCLSPKSSKHAGI